MRSIPECMDADHHISGSGQAVDAPVFNPSPGIYAGPQSIEISSATPDATIYYSLKGVDVFQYANPIPLTTSTTLYAIAVKEGFSVSDTAGGFYSIGSHNKVAAPTFNPPEGSYASPQTVTISSSTPDAVIYYSLNGIDVLEYAGPIDISSSTTVYAIALKEGLENSDVNVVNYMIGN